MTFRRGCQNVARLRPGTSLCPSSLLHPSNICVATLTTTQLTAEAAVQPSSSKASKPVASTSKGTIKTLWDQIHHVESYLKIPHSKTDGRWREARLRGKAKGLIIQKVEKMLAMQSLLSGSDDELPKVLSKLSPFERSLYGERETKKKGSTKKPSRDTTSDKTQSIRTGASGAVEDHAAEPGLSGTKKEKPSRVKQQLDIPVRPKRPQVLRTKTDSGKLLDPWKIEKAALHKKLEGERWNPRKRLSPDTLEAIRHLHTTNPEQYTTPVLAKHFEISPESVRRILKSKWQPDADESEARRERWERRGERIWTVKAAEGVKPPKQWRHMGVGRAEPGRFPQWKKGGRLKPRIEEDVPWDRRSFRQREKYKDDRQSSSMDGMLL